MNATIVKAFLRQRLTSPIRLLLLAFLFLSPLAIVAITRQLDPLDGVPAMFALVLAAGAIGQEVSSGVLTLTFARPLTRTSYVLSRWAAAGGFAAALGLVQVAAGLMAVVARGGTVGPAEQLVALQLECIVVAFSASAVMVMLSSLVNGLGDVALWALGSVAGSVAGAVAQMKGWRVLERISTELQLVLMPKVHLGWAFGSGDPQPYLLIAALSTLAASLVVAVWVVNRKELSYASG